MGIGALIHKDDVFADLGYVAGCNGFAADGGKSAVGRSDDVVIALLTIFLRLPSNRYSRPDNRSKSSPEPPHHGATPMVLSLRRSALVSAACLVVLLCLASGSVLWACGLHAVWNAMAVLRTSAPGLERGATVAVAVLVLAVVVWRGYRSRGDRPPAPQAQEAP